MLKGSEILSVIEMLKNEHLDVRTVTLGISLLDCASDDIDRFLDRIHTKITHLAKNLVSACDQVGGKYGIPIVNKRISVSPIAVVGAPFSAEQLVLVAKALNQAAIDVKVDFIGGFSALVEKGIAPGDHEDRQRRPALSRADRRPAPASPCRPGDTPPPHRS